MDIIMIAKGSYDITAYNLIRFTVKQHTYKDRSFIVVEGFTPALYCGDDECASVLKLVSVIYTTSSYRGFIDRIRSNGNISINGETEPFITTIMACDGKMDEFEMYEKLYRHITENRKDDTHNDRS